MTPILLPSATVQPLGGVRITAEPLSATWVRFFSDIAPITCSRLRIPNRSRSGMYSEPLEDFLSGARALLEVLVAIRLQEIPRRHRSSSALRRAHTGITDGLPRVINALVAPIGLAAAPINPGRLRLNWVSNSLLVSLATMLLEDLSQG